MSSERIDSASCQPGLYWLAPGACIVRASSLSASSSVIATSSSSFFRTIPTPLLITPAAVAHAAVDRAVQRVRVGAGLALQDLGRAADPGGDLVVGRPRRLTTRSP